MAAWLIVALMPMGGLGVRKSAANPEGELVRHGAVTFERIDNELRILQGSQKAIIDWQSFSIGSGQSTIFLQPDSSSAALNRVRGPGASRIDGLLRANGRVYLINPNGIMVGPGGTIDVAGFIGSTLDVTDAEFLAGGDMNFRGDSEFGVINLGNISAFEGDIFLIGATVENHGALRAPNGTVGLAAGNDVLIMASGHERVFVRGATGATKETGVLNAGDIEANIAELKAHGGNVYGMAIRNEGRVAATGVTTEGGQIFLRAEGGSISNTGTLTARRQNGDGGRIEVDSGPGGTTELGGEVNVNSESGRGGEIIALGSQITLLPGAWLRADGRTGGGDIFIGGGLRGRDPGMQNAESVTVSEGARLSANALENGNGGRIVVFARDTLRFYGQASATGGAHGGDGGFVELSGQRRFDIPSISQQVSVRAVQGVAGTLLIDPIDILILPLADEGDYYAASILSESILYDTDIAEFLNVGNLIITTDTEGEIPGLGDITVGSGVGILWESSNNLTLIANHDIYFEPDSLISATGGGSIFMDAGRSITLEGSTLSTNSGGINLIARGLSPEPPEEGGDDLLITFGTFDFEIEPPYQAGVLLDNTLLSSGSGNIFIDGTGPESLFGESSIGVALINNSRIETTASGSIQIHGFGGAGEFDNHGVFLDSGSSVHAGGSLFILGESQAPGTGVMFSGTSGDVTTSGLIGEFDEGHFFGIQGNASGDTGFGVSLLNEAARIGWAGVGEPPSGEDLPSLEVIANTGRIQIQRAVTLADSVYLYSPAEVISGPVSDVGSLFIEAPSIVLGSETIVLGDITLLIGNPSETPQPGMIQILADTATDGQLKLLGGAGHDQFIVSASLPENVMFDGGGDFYNGDEGEGEGGFETLSFGSFEFEEGGGGTAELTFAGAPGAVTLDIETLSSITQVTGSGNSDTLLGPNASTTFNLTGEDAFNANDILFTSFENISGRGTADQFVFGPSLSSGLSGNAVTTGPSGALDYSAREDNIEVNFADQTATGIGGVFEGVNSFIGGSGNNSFTGPDGGFTYNITALDTFSIDDVLSAQGFGNLTGGSGSEDDTFQFLIDTGLSGTLGGGGGTNTLDYSLFETEVTTNFALQTSTGIDGGFSQITNFIGSTEVDQFIGPDLGTDYDITGLNTFETTLFTVSGYENLTGGPGADTFRMLAGGVLTGQLAGGLGTDSLDYSGFGGPATINFATGSANALGSFVSIEDFIGGTGSNSFTGPNTSSIYQFTDIDIFFIADVLTATGFQNLTGGDADDTFRFAVETGLTGMLAGGGGTNTLNYSGFGSAVTTDFALQTSTGIDGGFSQITNFIGSTEVDQFIGPDLGTDYDITGLNTFETALFTVEGYENLTGGTGSDTFAVLPGGSLTGGLNGGLGDNTLDYSAFGTAVTTNFQALTSTGIGGGFSQIADFIGSAQSDQFIGPDAGTVYDITGLNTFATGLFTVTGYENLTGGPAGDTFRMLAGGQLTGQLAGSGGTDSLNYSGFGGPATVNLGTNTATAIGSFASLENFVGGSGTNTLIGGNGGQTFNVTGNNAGAVVGRGTFSGFQTLRGGGGNDTFNFLNLATVGLVDGVGGTNLLFINNSGFNSGRTYNISATQLTGPRTYNFSNIQTLRLQLGSGNDTVNTQVHGFSQVLNGGGGTNTLNLAGIFPGGSGTFNNVDYSNFELPALGGSIDLGEILDLQLNQQLDQFAGLDDAGFEVENRFAFLDGNEAFNQLALLPLNDLGVEEFGDSFIIAAGIGDPAIMFTVFVLDGSNLKPSNFALAALAEQLGAASTLELAAALGLDENLLLTPLDGPVALDLSGAPADPLLLALLAGQLSPAAAAELLAALGLEVLLELTPGNGPIVIGLPPGVPDPAVVLILGLQLTAEAEAELRAALTPDQ